MRPLVVAALILLAGCASTRTGLSLLPGEVDDQGATAPTGAVAVLDPANEQDIRVIDQANSRTGVDGAKVSVKQLPPGQLDAQYGDLLSLLPPRPATFILKFETGSTELANPAIIDDVLAEIGKRTGADIQIVGHTDTTGDGTLNDRVSAQRAEAIRGRLTARGVDDAIIRTSGRGERELRVQTGDNVDNAENRRVEITVR